MERQFSTCWKTIQGASEGDAACRDEFARCYSPAIHAYLSARWRGSPRLQDVDDASQEVFLECFRDRGALSRATPDRPGGFRAYLYGVVRNIARRFEAARPDKHAAPPPDHHNDDGDEVARAFDREWALGIMAEARALLEKRAEAAGEGALRRLELLRARFEENIPIRDLSASWQVDPALLHHEFARARREFRDALLDVIAAYLPPHSAGREQECRHLLTCLQ